MVLIKIPKCFGNRFGFSIQFDSIDTFIHFQWIGVLHHGIHNYTNNLLECKDFFFGFVLLQIMKNTVRILTTK